MKQMKFTKTQLAKLILLIMLLLVVPFVRSSLRTSYVYVILNILIVALGLESELLSVHSYSSENKSTSSKVAAPTHSGSHASSSDNPNVPANKEISTDPEDGVTNNNKRVDPTPPAAKKIAVSLVQKVKRIPSKPSLFFIGSFEEEAANRKEEKLLYKEQSEKVGDISAHELFLKAEVFIGNFYKQLRMQREESWKKIHGFYKAAY